MKMIDAPLLERVRAGDLDTLKRLDDAGLLMGPAETLDAYAARMETLAANIGEFEADLRKDKEVDLFGTPLANKDAIPAKVWLQAQEVTRKLYGFSIDWVPGFFTDHRMGMLFAGCAYYTYEDFFAVFVVRNSFRKQERWLIYSRTELIAHELCHIAHIGFRTRNYEELFAYQTSTSGFRKLVGGLFRSTTDTYLLLGTTLSLLVAQIINTRTRLPEHWNDMPMPLVWAAAASVGAWISLRYLWVLRRFSRARRSLQTVFGERAGAVLFRCDEPDIQALADLGGDAAATQAWLEARGEDPRWLMIRRKFAKK